MIIIIIIFIIIIIIIYIIIIIIIIIIITWTCSWLGIIANLHDQVFDPQYPQVTSLVHGAG